MYVSLQLKFHVYMFQIHRKMFYSMTAVKFNLCKIKILLKKNCVLYKIKWICTVLK